MNIPRGEILKHICDHYGITPEYLFNKKKDSARITKRQIAIYLLLSDSKITLMGLVGLIKEKTGFFYNHATLIHSRQKISFEKDIYEDVMNDIKQIRSKYQSNTINGLIVEDVNLLHFAVDKSKQYLFQ